MKFNKKQVEAIEKEMGRTLTAEEIASGKVELKLKTRWNWIPDATATIKREKWFNESYICICRKANEFNETYGWYSRHLCTDAEVRNGLNKMLEYWTAE